MDTPSDITIEDTEVSPSTLVNFPARNPKLDIDSSNFQCDVFYCSICNTAFFQILPNCIQCCGCNSLYDYKKITEGYYKATGKTKIELPNI